MSDDTINRAEERSAAHLGAAAAAIDAQFGEGYAAQNPTLVAAFLLSATAETAILSGEATVRKLDERIERSTERVCGAMESLRPRLFG